MPLALFDPEDLGIAAFPVTAVHIGHRLQILLFARGETSRNNGTRAPNPERDLTGSMSRPR